MIVRKSLLLLFCFVLITSFMHAKVIDGIYQIPKTTIAPTIDGVEDAVWKTLDWNFQRIYTVDGTATEDSALHEGMSKAMWDDTNLYILFYSQDPVICDNPSQTAGWNKDGVEIYIDADNSKIPDNVSPDPGGGLAPGDIQLTIPHIYMGSEAANVANIGFPSGISTDGVEFAIAEDDNVNSLGGWWLELKIPLDNIDLPAEAGTEIGWELQQDMSDDNTQRQWMSKWWSNSNNTWSDASIWGTAVLSGRVVDSTLVINKTDKAITIDGEMDDAYKAANPVSMNLWRVDGGGNIEDLMFDNFSTTYLLYDDANLYVYFDVIDDDIEDNPTQTAGWNKDGVEFYIDPDNSKIPDNVSPDPGGGLAPGDIQLTMPHAYMGSEEANVANIGFPSGISTDGVEFKIVEQDATPYFGGGWSLELKIPVDNIDLVASEGQELGIEIQNDESDADDNGARGSMEKWWKGSNNSWSDASLWGTAKLGPLASVGVKEKPVKVVDRYSLSQNYPNPFNPTTKISFSIKEPGLVKLNVYNLLGQLVSTVVNKELNAGYFETDFNAVNLPSGIYFYKLEAGNMVMTKKMMLLK
jgi:hypothetical protein